jgi:hypothetical protein
MMKIDERNRQVAYKIIAVMYLLTIMAMQGVMLYRQFALGQDYRQFEDMAVIATVNVIFLISGLLYFGAIPVQRLKLSAVLKLYFIILILGSLFVYVKYNIAMDAGLSFFGLMEKIFVTASVTGLLVLFFVIFSLLGRRKMEKELE